jgi:site-specific recombinase XerD
VHPAGEDGLIFTSREHKPISRTYYNPHIWKPALVRAGVEPTRANAMHALRHYWASVLLDGGESVRALTLDIPIPVSPCASTAA